jgi:hypothetical protein
MAEEVRQPGTPEQAPASSPQAPAPSSEPQTLDEVYYKFNVEESAREFRDRAAPREQPPRERQQPEAPQLPAIPDPITDQSGSQYIATNSHEVANLRQALQQYQGQLGAIQQAALLHREEADIGRATEVVNSHLDSKLDPEAIEIGLGIMARKDPKFMTIWANRHKNPAALNAALKVASKTLGAKFAMKTDPQIAENVRALKEATSGRATSDNPPASTAAERMQKATGAEFDKEWNRIRNRTA